MSFAVKEIIPSSRNFCRGLLGFLDRENIPIENEFQFQFPTYFVKL